MHPQRPPTSTCCETEALKKETANILMCGNEGQGPVHVGVANKKLGFERCLLVVEGVPSHRHSVESAETITLENSHEVLIQVQCRVVMINRLQQPYMRHIHEASSLFSQPTAP